MASRPGDDDRPRCLARTDQAVSPVIGVIIMVAITVVLSVVVMMLLGQFAQDTRPPAFPQATFRADEAPTADRDLSLFTLQHNVGNCLALDDFRFILEHPDGSEFEPAVTDNDDDVWCVGETLVIGETAAGQLDASDSKVLMRLKVVHLDSEHVVFDRSKQLA